MSMDTYSTSLLAGAKAGRVHLCRVAGNTVWSDMASDVPYSCEMGVPINSYTLLLYVDSLEVDQISVSAPVSKKSLTNCFDMTNLSGLDRDHGCLGQTDRQTLKSAFKISPY